MCSCYSILECCVTFSGVKLSIRSIVLFLQDLITLGEESNSYGLDEVLDVINVSDDSIFNASHRSFCIKFEC